MGQDSLRFGFVEIGWEMIHEYLEGLWGGENWRGEVPGGGSLTDFGNRNVGHGDK